MPFSARNWASATALKPLLSISLRAHRLVPENWLVVKNLPDSLEVVSRVSLKKVGGKPRTRAISKSL